MNYQSQVNPQGQFHAAGRTNSVNTDSSQYLDAQFPDSFGAARLSIAVIGPDESLRNAVAKAFAECQQGGDVREFASYPPGLDDVPRLLEQRYDVIVIDLDSNPEYALELVESIGANGVATVMVYSAKADPDLLVRCMRAGAREFLTQPFALNTMAEAMVRAAARRPANHPLKKAGGRLLVFFGAKGGAGVTTIACNFAVALAQEPSQSTLLLDLDLPLGDAALNLGLVAEYSTVNALQESGRLDSSFLSKLLVKHSSGLYVLAAPGKLPQYQASDESIDRLLTVARQDFDNVVIDMGSRLDLMGTALFKEAKTIYLVTQAGIPELRNSNRLISQFFSAGDPKLEIVINRYQLRALGVDDEHITKALTRPAQWKIPNDYDAVRQMQNTATPLVLEDSPISRLIREMAGSVTGQPVPQGKKKGFSFRSLGRKSAAAEEPLSITPRSTPGPVHGGATLGATQPDARANTPEPLVHTPPAGTVPSSGPRTFLSTSTPTETADRADRADTKQEALPSGSTPNRQSEPATRIYKGVTYVKGADGQWHQQATETHVVTQETPTIAWSTPDPITYGTALSDTQLNATASVEGKFVYAPAVGYVFPAGTHTLWVIFTPADTTKYTTAQADASLAVTKATPTVTWPKPFSIPYGTALSATQLNARASVPGTFAYTPAAGDVLTAGIQTLSATFTPAVATNYTPAEAEAQLTVTKSAPAITWPTPAPIAYGTALSDAQLNATASVEGRFVYIPAAGAVLAAGTHTPSVTFTPADATNHTTAQAAVSLTVTKATPTITWPTPDPIAYGAALSATQLNARASVEGRFAYTPAAGAVLTAGTQTLTATFTPTDAADCTTAQAAVSLTVTKATPTIIAWPTPHDISYGSALSAAQLNATAPVPGTFAYTPAAGDVLAAGTHTLSVTFTPADSNLPTAQGTVSLTVTKATPTITWPTPHDISYGTALSAAQLNVTASIPGTFAYTPAAGDVLTAGTQMLSATFTPTDTTKYTTAEAAVSLTVTKATPTITWLTPDPIAYGSALSAAQLNARASVPGTFAYTPAAGTVLTAGTQTLSATFNPTDTADYTTAQATVSLVVDELPNLASVTLAAVDADAEDLFQPFQTDGDNKRGQKSRIESKTPQSGKTPNQQGEPETRAYKGATYVKGADGQWHLQ